MDEQTRTALEDSIAHWERMATGRQRVAEKPTGLWCALCKTFPEDCSGCPVMKKTGQPRCEDSPWGDAFDEWDNYGFSARFRNLAKLELEFLKSLRPTDKTTI